MDLSTLAFLIGTVYPAAEAAYLSMTVPTPPLNLPTGYTLVGIINADPSKAAPLMAQASAAAQSLTTKIVTESALFGVVAYSVQDSTVIVAIRGTQTIWDWAYDLDAVPLPWFADKDAGLVHMGFQLVYENIKDSIRTLVANCPPYTRLIVTGHSLGGAVAPLAAYELASLTGKPTEIYTFAAPRLGDPIFAHNFNARMKAGIRIVNFMDIVPQVPPPPYVHVGVETLVHGGFNIINLATAHHLETYLKGMEALAVKLAK